VRRRDGLCREAGNQLDLADGSHRFRSGLSPSGFVRLDVDGADHSVAARDVLAKVVEPVVNRVGR
jgi:hypothetical protein